MRKEKITLICSESISDRVNATLNDTLGKRANLTKSKNGAIIEYLFYPTRGEYFLLSTRIAIFKDELSEAHPSVF